MCNTDVQLCDAGLPYAWVNLRHGVFQNETEVETNTAACGSFTIEMGVLSRLTGMPTRLCFVIQNSANPANVPLEGDSFHYRRAKPCNPSTRSNLLNKFPRI